MFQLSPEIKRILLELLQFRKRLTYIAIAGVMLAACDTLMANLIKYVFDGLQFGKTEQIKMTLGILVALALVKGCFRYIHFFNMNYTAELVSQRLRQKLQLKFMKLNLSFHTNYAAGSGGLISRILYDITVIHHGLRMFADFFREPLLFIGLIATLFYLNWGLTLGILVILPVILLFLRQLSKSIKKYSERGQEDLEVITGTIKESLDGVRIIQSFNLENEMSRRFGMESENFLYSRKRIHSLIEFSGPVTEFTMTIVVCLILLYMTLEITQGRATYGDFMSYVAAMLMLSAPVKKLQESYVRIQETAVAARRVFQLLDEDSEVPQIAQPQPFPENWQVIRFENVSFRYGDNWVLRNINLDVKRGQLVAFVGTSGSGKSTLVNLLERFFDPTDGRILVDNVDIKNMSLHELRAKIAMVSQDVFLFSDTVERNIWAGDFSKTLETVKDAARRANADNFIQRAPKAYQSRVGDKGNLFSGGEKQRLSIARAFFKDAPVLVLDEATSALDSESEIEVQRGLDHLMEGRTALVIAHRLSTVARADVIYVLKAGNIVEAGTHNSLLERKSEYFKLHQMQNSAERSDV